MLFENNKIGQFLNKSSEFSKNVSLLMLGTLVSQLIQVIFSPYLTRIYSPSDFGEFSIYFSVVSTLAVIVTGRYEFAILLPKKNTDAQNVILFSLIVTFAVGIFFCFCGLLINNNNIVLFSNYNKVFSEWLPIIVLNTILIGIFQIFNFSLNREKNYKEITINRIILSAFTIIIQIAFFKIGYYGLVLGNCVGYMIANFYSGFLIKKTLHFPSIKWKKMLVLGKIYKELPLINGSHSLINILKDNYTNLFLASIYSKDIIGYYYLMFRIMKLPVAFIGNAISQVLLKNITENYGNNNIKEKVKKLIFYLFLLGVVPIIIIFFGGEEIFKFFFGKDWAMAGKMAEASSFFIFSHFIASPMTVIPIVLKKQKIAFFWGLSESILFVSVFIICNFMGKNLIESLYYLSIFYTIYFIFYLNWILQICEKSKQIS